MLLLDSGGSARWTRAFPDYAGVPYGTVFGRFGGDATIDIALLVTDQNLPESEDLRVVALDGRSGEELWNVPSVQEFEGSSQLHVLDLDSDSIDDHP